MLCFIYGNRTTLFPLWANIEMERLSVVQKVCLLFSALAFIKKSLGNFALSSTKCDLDRLQKLIVVKEYNKK